MTNYTCARSMPTHLVIAFIIARIIMGPIVEK